MYWNERLRNARRHFNYQRKLPLAILGDFDKISDYPGDTWIRIGDTTMT